MSRERLRRDLQEALGPSITLGRELGGGGMAHVFLARDERLGRDIALKVLDPELASRLSTERFMREIRLVAELVSPYIVPLLDAGSTPDGLPYFTMPFVRGESLRAHLLRSGPLSLRDALALLRDVARALAYAHGRAVVHRDVKPENVLLSGGTAIVADFGIAKALTAAATSRNDGDGLTDSGLALGTPAYMAPEQVAGDPALDARADIYAWGLVAYELLAGRHPFADRPTPAALFRAQLTETPAPLDEACPELPGAVARVVTACLSKEPADRPSDAGELAAVLEAGAGSAVAHGPPRRRIAEHAFRLSEQVCRRIDRASLDPRVIGDEIHYLENDASSDVLLFCIHGMGHEGAEFAELLANTRHRAIAPTLYGFDPVATLPRVPVGIDVQLTLLRELLRSAVERTAARRTVLVGFSTGADLALRMIADGGDDLPRVDACLAMGPNLSLDTCFVSRAFAQLAPSAGPARVEDVRRIGADAADVDEWLTVTAYVVHAIRKFHGDRAPLARCAAGVIAPFERDGQPFAGWVRAVARRVTTLRCIFERSPTCLRLLDDLRLAHLDRGVLGAVDAADVLRLEPTESHHALMETDRLLRHVEAVVSTLG